MQKLLHLPFHAASLAFTCGQMSSIAILQAQSRQVIHKCVFCQYA